jgi:hypothetical protein
MHLLARHEMGETPLCPLLMLPELQLGRFDQLGRSPGIGTQAHRAPRAGGSIQSPSPACRHALTGVGNFRWPSPLTPQGMHHLPRFRAYLPA